MKARPPPDHERRKLFRRMEWVYVYAPPLLILFIGGFGSVFLAWLVPLPGLGFWARWALAMMIVVGLPVLAYVIRSWWTR
jgi:hypothetical protein